MPTQFQLAVNGVQRLHPGKAAVLARRIASGWHDSAPCAQAAIPDAWFPDPATPKADLAAPLAVCATCPVRRSCLAFGLLGADTGLWGGLTDLEREEALDDLAAGAGVDATLDRLLAVAANAAVGVTGALFARGAA